MLLLLARSASGGGLKLIVYSHVPSRLVSHHPIQPIPTGTAIYSSSSSILSYPCERLTRQFGIVTQMFIQKSLHHHSNHAHHTFFPESSRTSLPQRYCTCTATARTASIPSNLLTSCGSSHAACRMGMEVKPATWVVLLGPPHLPLLRRRRAEEMQGRRWYVE